MNHHSTANSEQRSIVEEAKNPKLFNKVLSSFDPFYVLGEADIGKFSHVKVDEEIHL